MHSRISTNVGAPISNSYGTDAITKKLRHITIEPKLTDTPGTDPAQLPEVPSATIIRLSVGDNFNLNFLANLSDMTFEIAPESKNRIKLKNILTIKLLGDGSG